MITRRTLSGLGLAMLTAPAAFAQAKESHSPIWKVLEKTTMTSGARAGVFNAQHPESVKALSGKIVTLSGFVFAVEAREPYNHYILSRYPADCPFCPPGHPMFSVEIFSTHPVYNTNEEVVVKGQFAVANTSTGGLFFKLTNASLQ